MGELGSFIYQKTVEKRREDRLLTNYSNSFLTSESHFFLFKEKLRTTS